MTGIANLNNIGNNFATTQIYLPVADVLRQAKKVLETEMAGISEIIDNLD